MSRDAEGNIRALVETLGDGILASMNKDMVQEFPHWSEEKRKEKLEPVRAMLWPVLGLVAQMLVDLNRIADAAELRATNDEARMSRELGNTWTREIITHSRYRCERCGKVHAEFAGLVGKILDRIAAND